MPPSSLSCFSPVGSESDQHLNCSGASMEIVQMLLGSPSLFRLSIFAEVLSFIIAIPSRDSVAALPRPPGALEMRLCLYEDKQDRVRGS